jgi:hypothetical protein
VAKGIVSRRSPFSQGDLVEIRKPDLSPSGFQAKVKEVQQNFKDKEMTIVFDEMLPAQIDQNSIFFNHRYDSHNCILQHCFFHENRARGVLCNSHDWLIENCRFYFDPDSTAAVVVRDNRAPGN